MTPLFEVRGLTKRYLGLTAVDDLSYAVEPGAMVGIIGPNGSGKSTGVDCISGFQAPDAGRWFLDGQELSGMPAHRIARAGLIRTFQNVQAYEGLSLIENLCVARQESDGVGWLTALRRGRDLKKAEATARARGTELLELVGLGIYAEAPAAILSYGQRKLLAIAACLMARPKLIILDEPVAGVNPTMILHITEVIRKLNAEGIALIIIEHNVDFVMSLCGRVIVIEAGRKIADAAPEIVRADPRVLAAYLGKAGAAQAAGAHG